jgi:hypothetical protein
MDLHRLGEARSIAMHRAIAHLIEADAAVLERARERVRGWLLSGAVHPTYAQAWSSLLDQPVDRIVAALVDPTERATELRQVSPFAGSLDAKTRWAIRREALRAAR